MRCEHLSAALETESVASPGKIGFIQRQCGKTWGILGACRRVERPTLKLHQVRRAFLGRKAVATMITVCKSRAATKKPFRRRIPKFSALRWDKIDFSCRSHAFPFESRGQVFHTLILRNVDEGWRRPAGLSHSRSRRSFCRRSCALCTTSMKSSARVAVLRRVCAKWSRSPDRRHGVDPGRNGAGKEVFARAIHAASQRGIGPLVKVNCAAIPATLIESEFFGHEKGAFHWCNRQREAGSRWLMAGPSSGRSRRTAVGTPKQTLAVLQEGSFEPVGGSKTQKVDVRVVAYQSRSGAGDRRRPFRQDLFYRLNCSRCPCRPA